MKPTLAVDLDGTLVSCAPRHAALMRHVCRGDGLAEDFIPRYWAAKREGASNLVALRELGHAAPAARAAAWGRDIEHWPWLGFDRLLPGVAEALSARRHRVVVLTARREPVFARQQLDRLGLARWVDDVIVVPPNAAAEAKARHLQDLKPVAFIGDAETDAAAAQAASVAFIALECGMRSPAFWQRQGRASLPDLTAALAALPS
jgi:phosphoglycolate phosphatase-like HAD superfamily hydrolase